MDEGESSGGWCERCWCGEFAGNARDSVIPLGWAQWAMERWRDVQLSGLPFGEVSGRRVFGVDVARSGNDECAIAIRQGDVVCQPPPPQTRRRREASDAIHAASRSA